MPLPAALEMEVTGGMEVIRSGDRAYHYRSDSHCQIRTLSPLHLEKDVEFYEVVLQPGGALRSAPHFRGTREFLTVQKGRVRVESAGGAEELEPGGGRQAPVRPAERQRDPAAADADVRLPELPERPAALRVDADVPDLRMLEHDFGHECTRLQVTAPLEFEQIAFGADHGSGFEPLHQCGGGRGHLGSPR